jgi:hypothetical protein
MSLLAVGLVMMGTAAQAQSKPGLWETTSTTTWQQSPMTPEMAAKMQAMGAKNPFAGMTAKTKVCITQAEIDKFGGPTPQQQSGCTMENVQKSATAMHAEMVCTGHMQGKGVIDATHVDSTHSTVKMHFSGTGGPQGRPVEFTVNGTSTYLGADCGSVTPEHPQIEPQQ